MKNILRILAVLALCVGTAFAQNQSGSVNSGGTVASPVTKLVAGTGISLSPTSGIGSVTVTASGTSGELITNDTTTNATMFPTWVTANTGTLPFFVSSTKLSFNPSTGLLSSSAYLATGTGTIKFGATAAATIGVSADTTAGNLVVTSPTTGAITFAPAGTEKARFAPTTGDLLLGGLTTDGTGMLQFPAGTTSAGGIALGTDIKIFREAADQLTFAGASTTQFRMSPGGSLRGYWTCSGTTNTFSSNAGSIILRGGDVDSITIDGSQGVTFAAKAVSTSPSAGVGYATGAGGAVTQLTDKTTAVTLNTVTGAVTTAATALGAGTSVGFTVNDSSAATTDYVGCSIDSGATLNSYTVTVDSIGAGTFHIHLRNESAGSLSEAIVIRFVVIKAVSS